jgi:hypothetical protein
MCRKMAENPPQKRLKRGHTFSQIHSRLMKFKNEILTAMDNLRTDQWITFCFVKILHCNGAYACSFSKAWCKTQRNLDDVDENKRLIVLLPDLFDFEVITKFLEKDGDIVNKMTENQIAAFDRLITFLENIEGKYSFSSS